MLFITLVVLALGCSNALPMIEPEHGNITIAAELLEDGRIMVEDMIMTFEQFNAFYPHIESVDSKTSIHKRVAVPSASSLWPNARIPYKWHSNLPGSQASVIQAMNTWMSKTCVKFVPATSSDSYYVVMQTGIHPETCNADLGFQRRVEGMFLNHNCFEQPTLLHELGHILGLIHEHQHPNRDTYLTINWGNIDPANTQWFKVDGSAHGVAYDIYSIMHYTSTAFGKKGCIGANCITMTSKYGSQYDRYMGASQTLSTYSDIPIINKLYCGGSGY